jgi:glycosyltransferase involved in cell wall biosynthesis
MSEMSEFYAINARFVTRPFTGVQRYCYEVCLRLQNGTLMSPRPALMDYQRLQHRVVISGGRLDGHPWEQIALPWVVPRRKTLFSPAGCGPFAHSNQVVTIHDLGPLDMPESYSRGFALWYAQLVPALARRARKIVTVSEYCRRRIVKSLNVPDHKVIVAGEAASASFFRRSDAEIAVVRERFGIRTPYFLAIGAISPRKNLARLLTAWDRVTDIVDGAVLVIVGKERLRFAASSIMNTLPERAMHLTAVSDDELASLYSGARGLLYPSLYEGFGLPILEAMASGCPVLTSNCTAMPEIAGDAAILVDPLSVGSIAEGIRFLADDSWARSLAQKGVLRCRDFSWERTAQSVENALLN